jgi:hypothetical protein
MHVNILYILGHRMKSMEVLCASIDIHMRAACGQGYVLATLKRDKIFVSLFGDDRSKRYTAGEQMAIGKTW